MRLDLHTPEQFAAVELWLQQAGGTHDATATLIRHAREAGVSILNLAHPTADLLPEDLERRPALVLVCGVASGPKDWPMLPALMAASDCAFVRQMQPDLAEHYVSAVNKAREVGRVLLVETTELLAHDWARAFGLAGMQGGSIVPCDVETAGCVGATVH